MKFKLDIQRPGELSEWLTANDLLQTGEEIESLEVAGQGNMNLTLRARTASRTLIVKQANPFVQKYPSIAAPVERSGVEAEFLRRMAQNKELHKYVPALLFHDAKSHIQVMEDLGSASDFCAYYHAQNGIPADDLLFLLGFLKLLHPTGKVLDPILNGEMKALNHFHIFIFPFDEASGFDLDGVHPGLADLAIRNIFSQIVISKRAAELGDVYLKGPGSALLHGDFFPGSWLRARGGVKIIDPEFSFTGPAEFDLGVFMAHLIFCGTDPESAELSLSHYGGNFDMRLTKGFAATEILRRLFGVAQLPLPADINKKTKWAEYAVNILKQ